MLNDGPTRWSKKFSDRFSRFDTIPAVTETQPPSQPPSHVAVAITLNAKASTLKTAYATECIGLSCCVQRLPVIDSQQLHASLDTDRLQPRTA